MSLAASFLPSVAFALRASRVAALPLLTHAAAQAGYIERLSGRFIMFVRCRLHKVLLTIGSGCRRTPLFYVQDLLSSPVFHPGATKLPL